MSDFVTQFGNLYDRTKKKIVKKPGLLEAAELFDSYSKQLPPEQKSLCHIGASQCYKSCGEEIEQVKQLVSAAVLLLKEEEGNREDNLLSGLSLLGRAIDICTRQNCSFLAFKLCLEASSACVHLDFYAKSVPWLKRATEIDTGSNIHKLTAVDLLLKSLIYEGDLHQALSVASESLKDLQSDKKSSFQLLKEEIATLKVSILLLYSVLKPRTGYDFVEVWSTEIKEFQETNLSEGIAFGLGNLLLALEEGDLNSVKEAQEILSPLLKDEQNILVQLLIDGTEISI